MQTRLIHRLSIKQLQALVALEQARTLSAAAELLGISQPAFSSRLSEIERLCQTRCFNRINNRLSFTQSGFTLLNAAKLILDELHRAEAFINDANKSVLDTVRLETRGYTLDRWLAPVLAGFMTGAPDMLVEVSYSTGSLPLDELHRGVVDLSLSMGSFMRPGLERHHLFDDELVAVVPADHPLAERAFLTPEDFQPEVLVTYSGIAERGLEVEHFFAPAGIAPGLVVSVGSSQLACEMVANGAGLSILGRWAMAQQQPAANVVYILLGEAGLQVAWYAICRQGETAKPGLNRLLDALLDAGKKAGAGWHANLP